MPALPAWHSLEDLDHDASATIDLSGDLVQARAAFDAFLTSIPTPVDVTTSVTRLDGIPVIDVGIEGAVGRPCCSTGTAAPMSWAPPPHRSGSRPRSRVRVRPVRLWSTTGSRLSTRPPQALEDAVAACTALLDSGVRSGQVVVVGESAGGGLALALEISLRDRGLPLPGGAVVFARAEWTRRCPGGSFVAPAALDPVLLLLHWPCLRDATPQTSQTRSSVHSSPTCRGFRSCWYRSARPRSCSTTLPPSRREPERPTSPSPSRWSPAATQVSQNQHGSLPAADAALARAGAFVQRIRQHPAGMSSHEAREKSRPALPSLG